MFPGSLLLAAFVFFVCTAAAGQVVDLGYAKYRGNISFPSTVAFLGLPYAEPPLGERRWRAPLPLDTARISRQSKGRTIDASKNPSFCIQMSTGGARRWYSVETHEADMYMLSGRRRWSGERGLSSCQRLCPLGHKAR